MVRYFLIHFRHSTYLFLFLTYQSFISSQILLNEVAPRPHNSGHQTIECCYTSQFEQHLRAVVGLPLGDPSMRTPASIMYNILGEDDVIDVYLYFIVSIFLIIIPIALSSYPFNEHVVAFWFHFFFLNQGEAGFKLAHRLIARALCIPGASVHWYDKPG